VVFLRFPRENHTPLLEPHCWAMVGGFSNFEVGRGTQREIFSSVAGRTSMWSGYKNMSGICLKCSSTSEFQLNQVHFLPVIQSVEKRSLDHYCGLVYTVITQFNFKQTKRQYHMCEGIHHLVTPYL